MIPSNDPRVLMLSDASSLVGYLEAYTNPLPGSRGIQPADLDPLLKKARAIRDGLRQSLEENP